MKGLGAPPAIFRAQPRWTFAFGVVPPAKHVEQSTCSPTLEHSAANFATPPPHPHDAFQLSPDHPSNVSASLQPAQPPGARSFGRAAHAEASLARTVPLSGVTLAQPAYPCRHAVSAPTALKPLATLPLHEQQQPSAPSISPQRPGLQTVLALICAPSPLTPCASRLTFGPSLPSPRRRCAPASKQHRPWLFPPGPVALTA
mmetsp:Transcript_8898/g.22226  ORF Transcript_8898/g.22226 Transcript_8898/m.22226 type:complete len:201 (-) Transcript_8898:718-1320(-)